MKNISILLGLLFFMTNITQASNPQKIQLKAEKKLHLKEPLQKSGKNFITAASGIVKVKEKFYIVSDDELSLFSFEHKDAHLTHHKLIEGSLPIQKEARKAEKADFESIAYLSAEDWPPYGALVVWPSGSSLNRMRAFTIAFTKDLKLEKAESVDILPLAYTLQPKVKELNMEGLLVRDGKVFIFQRGNSKKGKDGIISIKLADWIKGLKSKKWNVKFDFESIKVGSLGGVKLSFTDATWTKHGLLALASAEDSVSAYADGAVVGTVLVRLVAGKAEVLGQFEPNTKLEGIAAEDLANGGLKLFLVDDADDPEKASQLYTTELSEAILSGLKTKK